MACDDSHLGNICCKSILWLRFSRKGHTLRLPRRELQNSTGTRQPTVQEPRSVFVPFYRTRFRRIHFSKNVPSNVLSGRLQPVLTPKIQESLFRLAVDKIGSKNFCSSLVWLGSTRTFASGRLLIRQVNDKAICPGCSPICKKQRLRT